jgi:hypothetical protein
MTLTGPSVMSGWSTPTNGEPSAEAAATSIVMEGSLMKCTLRERRVRARQVRAQPRPCP